MNNFEKMLELQKAKDNLKILSTTKQREFNEVFSAIKDRVEKDRERAEVRLSELKKLIQDTSKAETLRRVYAAEIEKLEAEPSSPTEAEKETLKAAFSEYKNTVLELSKVNHLFRDTLREVRAELEKLAKTPEFDGASHRVYLMEREEERVRNFANICV